MEKLRLNLRYGYFALFSFAIGFVFTFYLLSSHVSYIYGYDLDRLYRDAVVQAVRARDPKLAGEILDEVFSRIIGGKDVYIFSRYIYDTRHFGKTDYNNKME